MPCIRSEDVTDWTNDLTAVNAAIAVISAGILTGSLEGVKKYSFGSGTGIQSEDFQTPWDQISTGVSAVSTSEFSPNLFTTL